MFKKYLSFARETADKKGLMDLRDVNLKKTSFKKRYISLEDGLSLIEMAIAILVVGLIVTPILQTYNTKIMQENLNESEAALVSVENAINQYLMSGNGHYPCPANLFSKEGDNDYGKSFENSSGDCALDDIKLCTDSDWKNDGVCKTDNDADKAVIIGGVPFSDIKIYQERSIDAWGNKIIYAVTFEQTDVATFGSNDGQIDVKSVDDPVKVNLGTADGIPDVIASAMDFFIFSTGATGVGGYSKDGVALADCGDDGDGYESENCDFDNIFFYDANPDNKTANARSAVVGSRFFDDLTRAQESVPVDTWFQHPNNHIYSNKFVLTSSRRVGIGTTTPSTTIDVEGDLRVEGMVKTRKVCDHDGNCFDPELITGSKNSMKCDWDDSMYGHQAVMKLANSKVSCSSTLNTSSTPIEGEGIAVDTTVVQVKTCGSGEMISGISASGELQCIIP